MATKAKPKTDAAASALIDAYIDRHADWRGELLARIRKLFHAADRAIVEEWKWMGSPVFSHDGIICVANAHKEKVKLTFNQGARLPDPHELFNAGLGGNNWRAIDLYEGDALDGAAFKALIRAAVELNKSARKA